MGSPINQKLFMPFGERLSTFLNSPHVTHAEVQDTLRIKGIFVGTTNKAKLGTFLSSTLLKPTELDRLTENFVGRESRPKRKTAQIQIKDKSSRWHEPLRSTLLSEDFSPASALKDVEFIDGPRIKVRSDKNEIEVTVVYEILRRDISREWTERELKFGATIVLTQNRNEINIDVSSKHSSPETESINDKIIRRITRILKVAGFTKTEDLQKITFCSFGDTERVLFFKRLTAGIRGTLEIGTVHDIDIKIHREKVFSDDDKVAWMKRSVRRLKVDGERLNDLFLLEIPEYYELYDINQMNVSYPFSVGTNKGAVRARFYFSGSPPSEGDDNREITCEFTWKAEGKINKTAREQIDGTLDKETRKLIKATYDRILQERSAGL